MTEVPQAPVTLGGLGAAGGPSGSLDGPGGPCDSGGPGAARSPRDPHQVPVGSPGVTGCPRGPHQVPGVSRESPSCPGVSPGCPWRVSIGSQSVPGCPGGPHRVPGVPGVSRESRGSPSGPGGSRRSRGSRPVSGPRCAGGGALEADVPHPSSPVADSQWGGGGRAGSAPRGFKAAPRARRRQRGERPLGRLLPPPWTDPPGPAPARHGESPGRRCSSPPLATGLGARGSAARGREGTLLGNRGFGRGWRGRGGPVGLGWATGHPGPAAIPR